MAATTSKKSSTKGRKPTTKKNKSTTKGKNHPSKDSSLSMVQYEIVTMLILALTIFVMIAIYFQSGGIVGDFVLRLFFGIFGVGAWIMPLAIFIATFLKLFNKGNERLTIKILLVFLAITFVSVSAHVIYVESPQITIKLFDDRAFFASLANYYNVSANYEVGGGFIGALVGDLLLWFVGEVGTIIVLIVVFISLFIAITEQSFLLIMKQFFDWVILSIKNLMNLFGTKWEQRQVKKAQAKQKAQAEQTERKDISKFKHARGMDPDKQEVETNDQVDHLKETSNEKKKKGGFVASLLKSTIYKEDDSYDFVKHIEAKEEQERRLRETLDSKQGSLDREIVANDGSNPSNRLEDMTRVPSYKIEPDFNETQVVSSYENSGVGFDGKLAQLTIDEKPEKISKADVEKGKKVIEQEILKEVESVEKVYKQPPLELLKENPARGKGMSSNDLKANARKLEETLASFGVGASVIDIAMGPSVTRYELQPDQGVKVSKIVNLSDDIALNLAASGIRIEAPIPGKSAVGIEVPNKTTFSVYLKEVLDTPEFDKFPSKVAFGLGKDISGKVIVTDIARMPHLLIAGATGSGKSVCVNTLITSILYKSSPDDVKLLMIDPKVVELSIYNGIPHLLIPVVTDPKKAASALNWAVQEMLERYKLFAAASVRDVKGYNKAVETNEDSLKKLPQIVIIVDELADLMVAAAGEVEEAICRLAQMARAAGLHLIIATQRPSVDVITGLIKANIPSRIAFNVSSGTDSRTIIDMNGAEKLLGKGDMLFYPVGLQKPIRVQGAFVSDKEVERIVAYLKDKKKEAYDEKIMMQLDRSINEKNAPSEDYDALFEEALELCVDKQKASASMIQRRFRVGYNRAARILDQLHDAGYVGDEEGSKPRKMILTKEGFEQLKARANGQEEHTHSETEHGETEQKSDQAIVEDVSQQS